MASARQNSVRAAGQCGMTLVEVLVAIAILGMVAASILVLIGQNTRFIASSEDRVMATILLDNEMVEALAASEPLERGDKIEAAPFAGRTWRVASTVTETAVAGLVRIDISVGPEESGQVLADATTLKREAP